MSSLRLNRTYSLAQTDELATALLALWRSQASALTVFTFVGPLGAGKTTLIRALCRQLGVIDEVTSPTFSLVNEYHSPTGPIYHCDMYRIDPARLHEAAQIGMPDYIDSGRLCLVEWPQHIISLLPAQFIDIRLAAQPAANEREIAVYW